MRKNVLIVALVLLLALVSCAEHECTWDAGEVTLKPTCTEEGEMTYTCTGCGATKTETIAALGHKWDGGETTTKASCEKEGIKTFTCTVCDATRTEAIEKVAHDLGEEYKCSMCRNYFYPSVEVMNEKAKREDVMKKTVTVVVGKQGFKENTYFEHSSGLGNNIKSFFIGNTNLNWYNSPALTDDEKATFVFKDGEITTDSTGYKDIDNHSDDKVYMLLPAGCDVVFENVVFNGSVCFDVQMFTAAWKVLGSITFKNCVFNGIIIGSCPADEIVFDGCTFNDYANSVDANNSNPIWMRPTVGSWPAEKTPHVSMHTIVFKNNKVFSSRPVKFERFGAKCTEEYNPQIEVFDNYFDISKENDANEKGKLKNVGLYIGRDSADISFTLKDDGNTKSDGTTALYTFVVEGIESGTKILDRDGNPKTLEYVTWKTNTVKTLESK